LGDGVIRGWLGAISVSAACALASCSDLDVVTHTYATMAEAKAAGAPADGWLPAFVPAGAHDIREAHDQGGTRRRWGLFNFAAADDAALRAQLGPEVGFAGTAVDAPPRIEWWPVLLRGPLDDERVTATGLRGYRVEGDDLVAAVNWSQRRAYYWTPAARATSR
jgi:hypothetical protein